MSWALLPEWFVEDMADYLVYCARYQPRVLHNQQLSDLMMFMVVFMGSPNYLKSPHLRGRLSEVVHALLPQQREDPSAGWQRGRCATYHGGAT